MVGVLAASGGAGGSTLAANLAVLLADVERAGGLDRHARWAPPIWKRCWTSGRSTTWPICAATWTAWTGTCSSNRWSRHASGAHLLAAPNALDEAADVTPQGVRRVLGLARTLFPYVIVDLDRGLRPEQLAVAVQADMLLLPMRLEIASLRSARRLLDALNKARVRRRAGDGSSPAATGRPRSCPWERSSRRSGWPFPSRFPMRRPTSTWRAIRACPWSWNVPAPRCRRASRSWPTAIRAVPASTARTAQRQDAVAVRRGLVGTGVACRGAACHSVTDAVPGEVCRRQQAAADGEKRPDAADNRAGHRTGAIGEGRIANVQRQ